MVGQLQLLLSFLNLFYTDLMKMDTLTMMKLRDSQWNINQNLFGQEQLHIAEK